MRRVCQACSAEAFSPPEAVIGPVAAVQVHLTHRAAADVGPSVREHTKAELSPNLSSTPFKPNQMFSKQRETQRLHEIKSLNS